MHSDVSVVELVRPMTSVYLQKEIGKRQDGRRAEIEELEAEIEELEEPEADALERLEVLKSVNGTHDAEEVLAANTIKIALRSITRREAFQRNQLQVQAREWIKDQAGVETYEEVQGQDVDDSIGSVWMAMYQAADIIPALVAEQCEGWEVPDKLEDWADVQDFIFTSALAEAWALNPQFTLISLEGEV